MAAEPHWLVTIPVTIPSDPIIAAATRPSHIQHLKSLRDAGTIVFSGPTLKEQPKEGQPFPAVTGSVMVIKAESEDEVRKIVGENMFAKVGAWDIEGAKVVPYLVALRAE